MEKYGEPGIYPQIIPYCIIQISLPLALIYSYISHLFIDLFDPQEESFIKNGLILISKHFERLFSFSISFIFPFSFFLSISFLCFSNSRNKLLFIMLIFKFKYFYAYVIQSTLILEERQLQLHQPLLLVVQELLLQMCGGYV